MSTKGIKLDKSEVRSPDAFLQASSKVSEIVKKNRGIVIGLLALAVVAGVGYAAWDLYNSSQEEKAQDALFAARKIADPDIANLAVREPKKEKLLNDQVVTSYEDVIHKFPHSRAAIVASLELSQSLLNAKRAAEAVKVLKEVPVSPNDKHVLAGFHTIQLAKALEMNKQCDQAVAPLDQLFNNAKLPMFKPEALLQKGLCQEQLNQTEQAKESYERIGREFPSSSTNDSATKLLRVLKQSKGEG